MPRMTTPTPIAEQLRAAIQSWTGTRQELADKADVSKAVIDKFMTTKKSLNLDTAEALGRALGLPSFRLK